MAERRHNRNTHINNDVAKAAVDLRLAHLLTKSRHTESEYLVQYLVISEILLILSEFNDQNINRSVCGFYIRLLTLRMFIKKAHHEANEEN